MLYYYNISVYLSVYITAGQSQITLCELVSSSFYSDLPQWVRLVGHSWRASSVTGLVFRKFSC